MKKLSPFIISLCTGILYCFGLTFYRGYIREFGLLESQFPLTIDRTLFEGFFCITTLSALAFLYLFLGGEFTLATAIITDAMLKRFKKINLHIFFKPSNKQLNTHTESDFVIFCTRMLKSTGILFIALIGIVLVMTAAERSGKATAQTVITNYNNNKYKTSTVTLRTGTKYYRAYLVSSNQLESAFLVGREIAILKNSDIYTSVIP